MTEPIKLTFQDVEVAIVRTYKLAEPAIVERPGDRIRATSFQVTTQTWTDGEDTQYDVIGHIVKADGSKDKRQQSGVFRLFRPSMDGLPDPRQPFIDAVDALARERE
jgi:hypothetical protein